MYYDTITLPAITVPGPRRVWVYCHTGRGRLRRAASLPIFLGKCLMLPLPVNGLHCHLPRQCSRIAACTPVGGAVLFCALSALVLYFSLYQSADGKTLAYAVFECPPALNLHRPAEEAPARRIGLEADWSAPVLPHRCSQYKRGSPACWARQTYNIPHRALV